MNKNLLSSGQKQSTIDSPCVRNCCLNQQDICVGCFRHIDEITGWSRKTSAQKADILVLCRKREEIAL